MGTRIYPNTTDNTVLEQLAEVPAGTAARLELLQSMMPPYNATARDEDAWYALVMEDEPLNRLHVFELYGYGRLRYDVRSIGLDPVSDTTSEPAFITDIMAASGLTPSALLLQTGIHWS